ncbi:tryptophan--tRNA ligase [Paludibacterium denitrificans]|uniref:tryptophan--tRNA ligase n=1 Tax=Paludibacterium denitrificans TaxID=2675226 RepID=UPI001E56DE0C|nr:tryptophan--tRNA ligase [Paludibacterium denitrificans]
MFANRILSGMRPTGSLHLGHYHGVIKNWVELQQTHDCYFMVADWHALTTNYDDVSIIQKSIWDMVIDWLAAGVDPEQSTIFIQSRVPQHAELHLALSMVTPLGWLERVPTYKDQIEKLSTKDLGTYGFLGYPLLQAADILVYKAGLVPVGEDQIPHVELTREVARRFNHLFGREPNFEELSLAAVKKMGKSGKTFAQLRTSYLQGGDNEALAAARELLAGSQNPGAADRERLA